MKSNLSLDDISKCDPREIQEHLDDLLKKIRGGNCDDNCKEDAGRNFDNHFKPPVPEEIQKAA